MPMPTTIEMNMTENRVRWPTTRVTTPMDHASVIASTPSMSTGLPTRMKARVMTTRVSAKASTSEMLLSWKAAVISSLESAGAPVTPACTFGKAGRSRAMAPRMRLDRGLIADEAALLAGRGLDEDEQQALVVGEEVARVGGRVLAEGEEGAPRRPVGAGPLEPARHLVEQHAQEARVHRAGPCLVARCRRGSRRRRPPSGC